MTVAPAPRMAIRSNKPLSEWVCTHLGLFLTGHYQGSGHRSRANTKIAYRIEDRRQIFQVYLFDELIFSIIASDWKPFSIQVLFTSYYDSYGQPTNTTCERLNALLDRLGSYRLLPGGVRVFRDHQRKMTCLGRGDEYVDVGENIAHVVFIKPNAESLEIVGTQIEYEVE